MIEVDSVRRNFSIGHYEPSYLGSHHPLAGHLGVPQLDSRTLIHWNQDPTPSQGTGSTVGAKSDEEDDDDDEEDRPFTPPPPRERLSYTRYQLELLNAIYIEVRYPNSTQKQLIAKRVGITREQVKIWFQNRRRKDVVGTSGKSKSCDTSTSSTSSTGSKDSEQQPSPVAVDGNESSSSDDISSNSSKDAEESVVPELVMKSVIGELLKFVNDPLKGKKNKKKSKSRKQKEKEKVKKGLSTTLLAGSYDMVSPPNQITPSAFFDKLKNGFNHSKGSSAFANPRDHQKPSHMNSLSTTSDITSATVSANSGINVSTHSNSNQVHYPFQGQQGHFLQNRFNGGLQSQTGALNCDIPVLSDLLSYKSCLEARHKEIMSSAIHSQQKPSTLPSTPAQRPESESKQYHHNSMNNFNSGRPLNGIYPFPFLADQPMLLSSLRHPDQILRPSPQYPMPHFGDDPFQPLLITSLGNPYFAPPASSWTGSSRPNPSVYTQL